MSMRSHQACARPATARGRWVCLLLLGLLAWDARADTNQLGKLLIFSARLPVVATPPASPAAHTRTNTTKLSVRTEMDTGLQPPFAGRDVPGSGYAQKRLRTENLAALFGEARPRGFFQRLATSAPPPPARGGPADQAWGRYAGAPPLPRICRDVLTHEAEGFSLLAR